MLAGRQKHGFDYPVNAAVHARHLEFVFEVGDGAQAADNDLRAFFMDEVHEQRVEADDFDIRQVAEDLGGHLDTIGERKARLLGRAFGNGQDQFVEQRGGAPDQVFVTAGDRVEGAGIDRNAMIEFVQADVPPVSRRNK